MNRFTKLTTALVAGVGLSVGGVAAAGAAPSTHKLNAYDRAFIIKNGRGNLAEITLGQITLARSHGSYARRLATVTIGDHRKAEAKLKAVAKADGLTVPTAPNAMQKKAAATLRTAHPSVALVYFKLQVAAHELAAHQAAQEIRYGSRPNVVAYAKYYLPVAQMHLKMARADLARLQQH